MSNSTVETLLKSSGWVRNPTFEISVFEKSGLDFSVCLLEKETFIVEQDGNVLAKFPNEDFYSLFWLLYQDRPYKHFINTIYTGVK